MPSGVKRRRSRNSGNDERETTSTIRAAVLIPDWQYRQREPGGVVIDFVKQD